MGDARGEYGRILLCELNDGADSASFSVKEMIGGEMGEALTEPGEVPHNEDNFYQVELLSMPLMEKSNEPIREIETLTAMFLA